MIPGQHNFVGDMDVATKLVTQQRCLVHAPLTEAVTSPAGLASVGMLMTLIDLGASHPALAACRPDWTATQDLSVHAAGWLTDGPVVVDNQLVRVGKKVIVVAADVYDGGGLDDFDELLAAIDERRGPDVTGGLALAARSLVTFARIPGLAAGGMDDYDPARWVGQVRRNTSGRTTAGTMYERMGFRSVEPDAGVLELDRTPYVANSIGTINGGAQAVLIGAAAEAMRPGLMATDMQIHYLSQVKTGPARTVGSVSRDAPDHSVLTFELLDAGDRNRLLALATVTLQRPPT